MTLGQEFRAFGHTMLEEVERLSEAQALIREINMGATAIGTGINAPSGYAATVCRELSRISRLTLIGDTSGTFESEKYLSRGTVVTLEHPKTNVNLAYISAKCSPRAQGTLTSSAP